jgi:hydrogenase maturation factor HypE
MADWRKLTIQVLLADGVIDTTEVKILRKELFADKKIDADEVKFLTELRTAAIKKAKAKKQSLKPEFEKLFYDALKTNLLADHKIDASEVKKLREILGKPSPTAKRKKDFLAGLKKEAKSVTPDFNRLCEEFGVK